MCNSCCYGDGGGYGWATVGMGIWLRQECFECSDTRSQPLGAPTLTFSFSMRDGMKLRLSAGRLVTGWIMTSWVKKSMAGCGDTQSR